MYLWFFLFYCLRMSMNVLSQCVDEPFDENNFYAHVSTKTVYEYVHGTIERSNPECRPVQLWMLMRHGTRHAGLEEIPKFMHLPKFQKMILKNHKSGRGCLRPEKLAAMKNWKPSRYLKPSYASSVASEGKRDAEYLGARVRAAFPELVVNRNQMSPISYAYRTTNHQRTIETLKAFMKGYFSADNVLQPQCTPEVEQIIEPHKHCAAWTPQIANHNDERNRFTLRPVFERLAIDVTVRLGYNGLLTFDQLYLMYSMCRYEYAWHKKPSVWCMVFSREEMKIFEFSEDLSYYYSCGPHCQLAGKLGCYALRDMFRNFEYLESNVPGDYPRIVSYCGHTVSVNLLMNALKVHEGQTPMKATDYGTAAATNREFRSSLQVPFLANIMAVFLKCQGGTRGGTTNKVMFYQNERPLNLPYCGGPLCKWSDFKRRFQQYIQRCRREC